MGIRIMEDGVMGENAVLLMRKVKIPLLGQALGIFKTLQKSFALPSGDAR